MAEIIIKIEYINFFKCKHSIATKQYLVKKENNRESEVNQIMTLDKSPNHRKWEKGEKIFKTARNNKTRTKMLIIRTFVSIAGLNVKGINYPINVTEWQNRKNLHFNFKPLYHGW